jgi:L-ascorbate metabolism protein UlaG (beta-lactamase superfamily)
MTTDVTVRYLGGPTALIELAGLRLLTDPTFDPPGDHPIGSRKLTKTIAGVLGPDDLGDLDAVLLSHDQHPDNLDHAGRALLDRVPLTLSTPAAADRLGGTVRGLTDWEHVDLVRPDGGSLRVTAVPARHGPPGCEPMTGEVTGFVLAGQQSRTIYISGDNAAEEHVTSVAERFGPVDLALLFAGAARTALMDGAPLTLTSRQAADAAATLDARRVIPLHFEGWAHFSEGRDSLLEAFAAAGLADRLHLLDLGARVVV